MNKTEVRQTKMFFEFSPIGEHRCAVMHHGRGKITAVELDVRDPQAQIHEIEARAFPEWPASNFKAGTLITHLEPGNNRTTKYFVDQQSALTIENHTVVEVVMHAEPGEWPCFHPAAASLYLTVDMDD